MRFAVLSFLVSSGLLLSSLPAVAAPHRLPSVEDERRPVEAAELADRVPADAGVGEGGTTSSSSSSSGAPRPSKPIELPSDYQGSATYGTYRSGNEVAYYEGEGCSGGSDYYYGDDGTVIYVGDDDDDDDSTPSSPSSPATPSAGDDDDDDDDDDVDIEWGDDDDDDDDDDSTSSYAAPQATRYAVAAPVRHEKSPVSRFAFVGVLLAFPLRRKLRLSSDDARRRNGSE